MTIQKNQMQQQWLNQNETLSSMIYQSLQTQVNYLTPNKSSDEDEDNKETDKPLSDHDG